MTAAFHICTLAVDGEPVPGHVHGGVLVPPTGANWLVHCASTRSVPLNTGAEYVLTIETREGVTIEGKTKLRRSDGQAHYFVGDEIPAELVAN